jgi:hypothetical protein
LVAFKKNVQVIIHLWNVLPIESRAPLLIQLVIAATLANKRCKLLSNLVSCSEKNYLLQALLLKFIRALPFRMFQERKEALGGATGFFVSWHGLVQYRPLGGGSTCKRKGDYKLNR